MPSQNLNNVSAFDEKVESCLQRKGGEGEREREMMMMMNDDDDDDDDDDRKAMAGTLED